MSLIARYTIVLSSFCVFPHRSPGCRRLLPVSLCIFVLLLPWSNLFCCRTPFKRSLLLCYRCCYTAFFKRTLNGPPAMKLNVSIFFCVCVRVFLNWPYRLQQCALKHVDRCPGRAVSSSGFTRSYRYTLGR